MNKWLILGWFGLGLVAACSSEEPGPQTDDKLRTESGFCNEWAKAACSDTAVMRCDSTKEQCLEQQAVHCSDIITVGYNSLNAQGCIDAVKRAYRDDTLTA